MPGKEEPICVTLSMVSTSVTSGTITTNIHSGTVVSTLKQAAMMIKLDGALADQQGVPEPDSPDLVKALCPLFPV